MTHTCMRKSEDGSDDAEGQALRSKVLAALLLNRTPGYHFLGNFLSLGYQEEADGTSVVTLEDPSFALDASGEADPLVCFVMADIALARGARNGLTHGRPLSTVSIHLQFMDESTSHTPVSKGRRTGAMGSDISGLATAEVLLRAGSISCRGSGAFMALKGPQVYQTPTDAEVHSGVRLFPADLGDEENKIFSRAVNCASGERSFIHRFMGFRMVSSGPSSRVDLENGSHLSNRVGKVQGGILLDLAAEAAAACLPAGWRLSSVSANYISTGEGPYLSASAELAHLGRATAVVNTVVSNSDGRSVLYALSTHIPSLY